MRITQRTLSQNSLAGLNYNLSAISKLQNQLSTGKAINQPSDSPTGTNSAMQLRQALAANNQYSRNMADGKTWLDTTDSTLSSMISQAQRVRDLTVQAMNTGAMSADDQSDMAVQVDQLRSSLLGLANTKLEGRPIFGGATSGGAAYDAAGGYIGRGGTSLEQATPNNRRISDAAQVRVDVTGAEAFGDTTTGAPDLFSVISSISTDMKSNTGDLGNQLAALDSVLGRMTSVLADVGARSKRLIDAQSVNSTLNIALTGQLSSVEDVDMPKTITALQLQQTGYQAALSVAGQALQPSLVDFLR